MYHTYKSAIAALILTSFAVIAPLNTAEAIVAPPKPWPHGNKPPVVRPTPRPWPPRHPPVRPTPRPRPPIYNHPPVRPRPMPSHPCRVNPYPPCYGPMR